MDFFMTTEINKNSIEMLENNLENVKFLQVSEDFVVATHHC